MWAGAQLRAGGEGRGSGSRHCGVPGSVLTLISCVTMVRVLSLSELQSAPPKSRDDTVYVPRHVAVGLNEIVWHPADTEKPLFFPGIKARGGGWGHSLPLIRVFARTVRYSEGRTPGWRSVPSSHGG